MWHLQRLLLIPCCAREIYTFDKKFKINDAVYFVHARLDFIIIYKLSTERFSSVLAVSTSCQARRLLPLRAKI